MPLHDVSAGGIPYTLLAQASPSGVASVTFNYAFSEFRWIELIWFLGTSSGSDQRFGCQINGDTTSGHYGWSITDTTAGVTGTTSTNAAYFGWVPSLSQSYGMGRALIPARYGGSTRGGMGSYGSEFAAGGVRSGYSTQGYSFSIGSNLSSIVLFCEAGNITGDISLNGIP
jgi:hypothetical protein